MTFFLYLLENGRWKATTLNGKQVGYGRTRLQAINEAKR